MIFRGYLMTFSTENDSQYETIGAIWDEFAKEYGIENIQGLGFGWTDSTIDYCFGFKEEITDVEYIKRLKKVNTFSDKPFRFNVIDIPDVEWTEFSGVTNKLSEMYNEVYSYGRPNYEIETFDTDGNCKVKIHYVEPEEKVLTPYYKVMRKAEKIAMLGNILAAIDFPLLCLWIFFIIKFSLEVSFLTLGIPIILAILVVLTHCGLLVRRQRKRQDLAVAVISLRLPEDERKQVAKKYKIERFVDSLVEVKFK